MKSFAASFFGRRVNVQQAQREGMNLYVRSLRELNENLSRPERSSAGQTVLSIAILTMCEYLTATTGTGWVQHMLGMTEFFRLQGFEIFKEPYIMWSFQIDRYSMILAAIAARSQTCLASEEWKTIPWEISGVKKDPVGYLVDLASELPALYVKFKRYLKTTDAYAKAELNFSLEADFADLLQRMRDWHNKWEREVKPQVEEIPLSQAEQRKCGFATTLVFDKLAETGYTFVLYNTTVIILLELWKTHRKAQMTLSTGTIPEGDVRRLPDIPADELTGQPNDELPGISSSSLIYQARKAAFDICRTIPLFIMPTGPWTHGVQMVIPIRMALIVFRQNGGSPQAAWLEECMHQIGGRQRGWEIGRYAMQEYGYS
ncbi:uncharacterized protein Z520_10329 [Fonsecaea multimorphosa CBS 102226]|uniref:Transcription factor domain-containing protein n=1 Tax=Fonsecaea multimorphosa CBS 102226 TaxID=1442371 RepID=A0A0D2JL53_9EURO|nr:uncharacterized protein Z520_10329 [Fonsecaea multimorphosa CBS 102226]KIX93992.1 hypothetical protein Z520_10329 [Fonsecaea multimorphosa CBS 102226]